MPCPDNVASAKTPSLLWAPNQELRPHRSRQAGWTFCFKNVYNPSRIRRRAGEKAPRNKGVHMSEGGAESTLESQIQLGLAPCRSMGREGRNNISLQPLAEVKSLTPLLLVTQEEPGSGTGRLRNYPGRQSMSSPGPNTSLKIYSNVSI